MDTIFICVGSWAAGMCDSVYVSSDTYCVCVCVQMGDQSEVMLFTFILPLDFSSSVSAGHRSVFGVFLWRVWTQSVCTCMYSVY